MALLALLGQIDFTFEDSVTYACLPLGQHHLKWASVSFQAFYFFPTFNPMHKFLQLRCCQLAGLDPFV